MPPQPPTDVAQFNFGTLAPVAAPAARPRPSKQILFTAWQIQKLLEAIEVTRTNPQYANSKLVGEVFLKFPELKIVRPIQPMPRASKGKVGIVEIVTPTIPPRQQTMLLYALLPGAEGKVCSACRQHDAHGPFRRCISGRDWTKQACLNCYWSGTGHKCTMRLEYDRRAAREQAEQEGTAPVFPENCEKKASDGELELWHEQLEGTLRLRGEQILKRQRALLAIPRERRHDEDDEMFDAE